MADVEALRASLLDAVAAAADLEALEAVRVRALGKSGEITQLLKTLGRLAPEERQVRGPRYQALREVVSDALAGRKAALEEEALARQLQADRVDVTLPVAPGPRGTLHPISQVMDELAEIFADLGFAVASGPEIEDEWHNFSALNIPEGHPARAMHDTFYFPDGQAGCLPERPAGAGGRMLLRTHTSPVQVRTMRTQAPPIRIIAPGRVYRSDSDATHTPMFHQVEALVIDRDIHMGHLKWTLETFIKAFFGVDDVVLRFRPSYFPFTEPSAEVDVGCEWVGGKGSGGALKIGGAGRDWLEVGGSGMVHPRVLRACGLDPDVWQGFAFGCGVDRLAMLKYGMTDLRAFFDGDLRWLTHYGFDPLVTPTLAAGLG